MAVTSFSQSSVNNQERKRTTFARGIAAYNGDEVKNVGGFRYHIFTNSGTLQVARGGLVEILVVGAGGGGGKRMGGGGGGGAIEPVSGYVAQTLSAGNYSVTIAAGGTGSTNQAVKGGTPSDTTFAGLSTITAKGGGGGGSNSSTAGDNGGSGGGACRVAAAGTASGSNTNAGGVGTGGGGNNNTGGGGGGATGVGGNGVATVRGGNGGQGKLLSDIDSALTSGNFTTFSGMTRVSSGGGGGMEPSGAGGTGGTGAGNGTATTATGGSATAFGCGGGGGGGNTAGLGAGGNGFKGLVIVRYAV